jgi:hypothetical protein
MKLSLRNCLADSHVVASIAIAVLIVWSLESMLRAVFYLIGTALWNVPDLVCSFGRADRLVLVESMIMIGTLCLRAFCFLAASWLLSRLAYGEGPLRTLMKYRAIVGRRNYA